MALFFPNVGYVQGMNFLAGFVLIVSGMDSFEAWNFIVNFFKKKRNLYFGLYATDFPILNFLTFSLKKSLEVSNP